jgi:hypothetical protein
LPSCKVLEKIIPGLSGASPEKGVVSQKSRILKVNLKDFFCVADFHGQFQRFFPKGVVRISDPPGDPPMSFYNVHRNVFTVKLIFEVTIGR